MSLGSILKNFGEQMHTHLNEVEASIQAKIDAADQAVHDKWDAMGAELKALEEKLAQKRAELAAVEAELAAVIGLKTAGEAAKVADAAASTVKPNEVVIILGKTDKPAEDAPKA